MSWYHKVKTFLAQLIESRAAEFTPRQSEKAGRKVDDEEDLQIPVWLWHMF